MSRRMLSLAAGLCLALIPLASAAEENYAAILLALPDSVPVVASSNSLTSGASVDAGDDPAFHTAHSRPFDEAAGQAVLAYIESAIAAAPGSEVAPPGPDDFGGLTPTKAFTEWYTSFGLDPANALDVAALYLVAAWAAQEGDIGAIVSLDADQLAAVRAQVISGELRFAFLLGFGDDLAAQRNRMIALTGLLIDGVESHSQSGTLDALAAVASDLFQDQIGELLLTDRGFVAP